MTVPTRPLLRSPPFPWVSAEVAAVSLSGETVIAEAAQEEIVAAIRAARVGGAFWQPPAILPHSPFALIAPADAEQRAIMLAQARDAGLDTYKLTDAVDPWSAIDTAVQIYTDARHELAALATIAGRMPTLFGPVEDAVVRRALSLWAYRDPFRNASTSIEQVVTTLAEWRILIDANRPVAALVGIAAWKRRALAPLFWAPGSRARPVRNTAAAVRRATRGDVIVAWPSREPADLRARAAAADVPVASVEDGFIRSVGLGSGLHPPYSIAVDRRGVHYDPDRPSDLEHLLASAMFAPALLARAAALRRSIVANRVGKYGGHGITPLPARRTGRRLVLVAGQVADDQSVRRGGGAVAGNLDLIARARACEPDAELWYRPHPDVDAGHRRGAVSDADALRYADLVVRGHAITDLLDHVDGVHVLTSLTGFEALLRGRDVTTHGVPFFAGWGLTRDRASTPARRHRRLSPDELVAGALILYPRYLDPVTYLPCSVELLVERFLTHADPPATLLTTLRAWQGQARGRINGLLARLH